jgi:hypothetical protein
MPPKLSCEHMSFAEFEPARVGFRDTPDFWHLIALGTLGLRVPGLLIFPACNRQVCPEIKTLTGLEKL